MVQNAIVIRRTTANASDLKSGALVLSNGQWGFATDDKILVVRDLLGNFYDIPCTDLLPDLLRVKQPVNNILSLPVATDGDLCLVKSESAYFYNFGSSWRKLADSNQIASLVSEQIALAISAHIAESDPHPQYILGTEIGNTIAPIESGKIPVQYLPSYVDDVLEFASIGAFPVVGESDKIYIAIDTNKIYRWGGSSYVEIASGGVALGETSSTAYRGDRGKIGFDHSQSTGNPHSTTIADITGLQTALDGKLSSASNPDLVAIEAISGTSGLLKKTAANTWALDTSSYATTTQLTNGSVTKVGTANVGSVTVPVYVNAGSMTACSGTLGVSITGNAATATTATKLGSSTVGSTNRPIYLNAGVPSSLSDTVGDNRRPVFLNAGALTPISDTVGSSDIPVYSNSGTLTACNQYFQANTGTLGAVETVGNKGNYNGLNVPGGKRVALISHSTNNEYGLFSPDDVKWLIYRDANNGQARTSFVPAVDSNSQELVTSAWVAPMLYPQSVGSNISSSSSYTPVHGQIRYAITTCSIGFNSIAQLPLGTSWWLATSNPSSGGYTVTVTYLNEQGVTRWFTMTGSTVSKCICKFTRCLSGAMLEFSAPNESI